MMDYGTYPALDRLDVRLQFVRRERMDASWSRLRGCGLRVASEVIDGSRGGEVDVRAREDGPLSSC